MVVGCRSRRSCTRRSWPAGCRCSPWPPRGADDDDSGETIYVVDEERGSLLAYDWAGDSWTTVAESERLRGVVEMAAGGGRVCVVAEGGEKVIVVDVKPKARKEPAAAAPSMWDVAAPAGKRVVALHVLPRMTRTVRTE
ncbi:hypothetical protein ACP70R_000316 [Stipagrostis hirtigluma subsp. patula]